MERSCPCFGSFVLQSCSCCHSNKRSKWRRSIKRINRCFPKFYGVIFTLVELKDSPNTVFLATFPYNSPLSGVHSKVAEFTPSIFSTLPSPCASLWQTTIRSTQWPCRRPSLIPYVLRVRKWQPLVALHPYIPVTIHSSAILNCSQESPSSYNQRVRTGAAASG